MYTKSIVILVLCIGTLFAAPIPIPKNRDIDLSKVQKFALTRNPKSNDYPYVIRLYPRTYTMTYTGQFPVLFHAHYVSGKAWKYKKCITLYQTPYMDEVNILHIIPVEKFEGSNNIYRCDIWRLGSILDEWYLIKLQ